MTPKHVKEIEKLCGLVEATERAFSGIVPRGVQEAIHKAKVSLLDALRAAERELPTR